MRAHIDLELRWGDQDAYGHVNNVAFARFLEEARVRLFWLGTAREATGMEQHFRADDPSGPKMLVASQQIEFTAVLNYSEATVVVEAWIGRLGGSSLEVHYEIVSANERQRTVFAKAISTMVLVDGETLRPVRLSEAGRASIADWQDDALTIGRPR